MAFADVFILLRGFSEASTDLLLVTYANVSDSHLQQPGQVVLRIFQWHEIPLNESVCSIAGMFLVSQNVVFLNTELKVASLQLLLVGSSSAFWRTPDERADLVSYTTVQTCLAIILPSFLLDSLPRTLSPTPLCQCLLLHLHNLIPPFTESVFTQVKYTCLMLGICYGWRVRGFWWTVVTTVNVVKEVKEIAHFERLSSYPWKML